jgi:hypothetical protein
MATTREEVEKLSLPELNRQISVFEWRAERPDTSASLRRAAFKQLTFLEDQRESIHGFPAPKRARF